MNEAVDSTINQISSSCVRAWSSFACSLHVALFRKGFGLAVGRWADWLNTGPPPPPPEKRLFPGRRVSSLVGIGIFYGKTICFPYTDEYRICYPYTFALVMFTNIDNGECFE